MYGKGGEVEANGRYHSREIWRDDHTIMRADKSLRG
jgi:hypothetical protein